MRVCQFRHDGKWTSAATARTLPHQEDLHHYSTEKDCAVKQTEPAHTTCAGSQMQKTYRLPEFRRHRDLRVQDLRYRAALLGGFGVLLECCGVSAGNFANDIDVALGDRP